MNFRVGVIGATGYIGTPYRREMREADDKFKIVALCARRRGPLEAAAKEDGCDFISDDWRQVAEHPDVNLLVVATPDRLHSQAVMAGIQSGKHIFCDKPVGADSRESFEMWKSCRDAGLAHFVPFWSRYTALFRRAKDITGSGRLGEVKGIIYRWHNPRPMDIPFTWRDDASLSSAGSIGDVGSHAYDAVRWITGSEARRVLVHADVISLAKPDLGEVNLEEAISWGNVHKIEESEKTKKGTAYDYATIIWEFDNGAIGALILSHSTYLRKGLSPELELHGTKASLSIDRVRGTLSLAQPGQTLPDVEKIDDSGSGNRFSNFVYPALKQRIEGGGSDHPGLEDGWRVQIFTDIASLSAKRGAWVERAELEPQDS